MYTKISVLIPTRLRIDRLETLITSYWRTTSGHSEMVFRVDDDDQTTQTYLKTVDNTSGHVLVVGPRFDGYRSMPIFFNEMAKAATGDVLMCGNDDMVFQSKNWDLDILQAANEFPDGLFNLGVNTFNQLHYPFSIVSRRAVDTLGFIWDPNIFWGDIYLRDVMGSLGRTMLLPHVQIDHDWAGFRPDRVFAETRPSKEVIEGSPTYWKTVHAPAVADAVEKLSSIKIDRKDEVVGRC